MPMLIILVLILTPSVSEWCHSVPVPCPATHPLPSPGARPALLPLQCRGARDSWGHVTPWPHLTQLGDSVIELIHPLSWGLCDLQVTSGGFLWL